MLAAAAEDKKRIILVNMIVKSDQRAAPETAPQSSAQQDPRLHLNLRQLEVFVATARSGSTRAAATRVARSQSAASAALSELEASLSTSLFDRVGRRLVLNPHGRALLPQAVALLDHAGEVQAFFEAEQRTPLRIAASLTIGEYLLPEHIASWKQARPESAVQLMIGNTSAVIKAVVALDVDLGFIEGLQTHPELQVRPWLSDDLVVVAATSHALAHGVCTHRQLAQATWIVREPGSGTRQSSDSWLVEHLGALRVEFELGSTEAIKRLAAAGAGLACLSRHAVTRELADGRLAVLRTRLPKAARRLVIVTRRERRLSRATADFVRHCFALATPTARTRQATQTTQTTRTTPTRQPP